MKIGVLTFHWGANHGAVLQAYATQEYLKNNYGAEVSIIDYYPLNQEISFKNAIKTKRIWNIPLNIRNVIKNSKIEFFRKNFNLTKRYYTNQQLIDDNLDYDILITGSDQVWNPYYLMHGERKVTPVYFLNFGNKNCKKVALSASFGCTEYEKKVQETAQPYVKKFDRISVREKSGLSILKKMGIENAVITADPTSLLCAEDYLALCEKEKPILSKYTAICVLRKQSKQISKGINKLAKCIGNKTVNIEKKSVEQWIKRIKDAEFVITNSFHCVMFCLKMHTQFAVVLEQGGLKGMNDRIYTLLEHFELQECIVKDFDTHMQDESAFDWQEIDIKMEQYAASLKKYLDDVVL